MRLLYLTQYFKFPDEKGGTRAFDLATSFVKEGMEVVIITATSNKNLKINKRWNVVDREGLQVHYIYLPYSNCKSYFKRILIFLQFLWFSSFRLFKIKKDLILATSTPLTIGIPAMINKWIKNIPYIFEVRDVWPEAVIAIGAIKSKTLQKILYALEEIIYKNAAAIIPLSVDMKKSISERYPKLDIPIVVIENISEINRFQEPVAGSKFIIKKLTNIQPRFSILYAGTFGKVNGISYVIDLAEKTLQRDVNLIYILIGEGSEKEEITTKALSKGVLNKNVFILDPIPKQDLPQLYYEVDMGSSFVINVPEFWFNSANKFFDTLAAGKPILINYKGWQEDVIKENLGYVLPPNVEEVIIEDFINYTKNENLHLIQRKNALEKAKNYYSLEIAVEKYLTLIQSINL